MKVLQIHPSLTSITLRYLVSGHSYLPNDSDFGDLQTLVNMQETIELPADYIRLMEECHVNAKPIKVKEMTHEDFISSAELVAGVTRRQKELLSGETIKFLQTRQIRLEKARPSNFFFKYDLNSDKVK